MTWIWMFLWPSILAVVVIAVLGLMLKGGISKSYVTGIVTWIAESVWKKKPLKSVKECITKLPADSPHQEWKGVAFIVYNTYAGTKRDPLKETVNDGREIGKFFEDVKYKVIPGKDLTYGQFMDTCDYLSAAKLLYPPSCTRFVVYFAGHGSNGNIIMQDGQAIRIKDVQRMLHDNLPKEVAKILLVDACRNSPTGIAKLCDLWCRFWSQLWCLTCRDNEIKCTPGSNELVAYATTEDHTAYNFDYGGFWTQKLIGKLYELKDKDILRVMTAVNNEMESKEPPNTGGYQQPQCVHGLKKDIYFWREAEEMNNGTGEDSGTEEDTDEYHTDTAASQDDNISAHDGLDTADNGTPSDHCILSFDDLHSELKSISHLYNKLGQQLDVPDSAMKFDSNNKSLQDKASDMLLLWLVQDKNPSWKTLIDAITNTKVKAPNLVKELQAKYKDKMDAEPKNSEINNDVAPEVAAFYNDLGLKLLDENVFQNMVYRFCGASDTKNRFFIVLTSWWTSNEKQYRTWECIVEALESRGMRQNNLANTIRTKYKL